MLGVLEDLVVYVSRTALNANDLKHEKEGDCEKHALYVGSSFFCFKRPS